MVTFDQFTPNRRNPKFRDCTVEFDIIVNHDAWNLNNYKVRALAIAGYIDGILNLVNENTLNQSAAAHALSGLGLYTFAGCNEFNWDEHLGGYCLTYRAVHFTEDKGSISGNL